jgi:hypothetical protein
MGNQGVVYARRGQFLLVETDFCVFAVRSSTGNASLGGDGDTAAQADEDQDGLLRMRHVAPVSGGCTDPKPPEVGTRLELADPRNSC